MALLELSLDVVRTLSRLTSLPHFLEPRHYHLHRYGIVQPLPNTLIEHLEYPFRTLAKLVKGDLFGPELLHEVHIFVPVVWA